MTTQVAHQKVGTGRAAALKDVLNSSELLAKEATQVLDGYGGHLNALIESVELVADRAQVRYLKLMITAGRVVSVDLGLQ